MAEQDETIGLDEWLGMSRPQRDLFHGTVDLGGEPVSEGQYAEIEKADPEFARHLLEAGQVRSQSTERTLEENRAERSTQSKLDGHNRRVFESTPLGQAVSTEPADIDPTQTPAVSLQEWQQIMARDPARGLALRKEGKVAMPQHLQDALASNRDDNSFLSRKVGEVL